MDAQQAFQRLTTLRREADVLTTCGSLLNWDERTGMPPKGAKFRSEQVGLIARLVHERATTNEIADLLNKVENSDLTKNPDAKATRIVRDIRRQFNRATKLPSSYVQELAEVSSQAEHVWVDARKNNDFKKFAPWLQKIVDLKRREIDIVGFKDHPYDALLDEFEPGAKTANVKKIFADLRSELTPMLQKITAAQKKPNASLLKGSFPIAKQQNFALAAAKAIGFDFTGGRLDVTTHPFCSTIGPGDCRLTTRYNESFFPEAFFGVMHEGGHGIYEQGLSPEDFGNAYGNPCSFGIHESQSRLWENQVGRSLVFWQRFFPIAQKEFAPTLDEISVHDFHFAINEVKPSFIRVEADEVTYNLHIILRFELELGLVTGDLKISDVPGAWNETFKKLFGVVPPSDSQGCLQDVHWAGAGIGYFPTYSLGNLYSAQFMAKARQELGDLDSQFARGEFVPLKKWLNEKVHAPGRSVMPDELCQRATGETLQPKYLIDYLRAKYSTCYGVKL